MLRVHFLNVGHGDCTIIEHPSGRLTVIDINNSQDYDEDSLKAFKEERARKTKPRLGGLNALAAPALSSPFLGSLAIPQTSFEGLGSLLGTYEPPKPRSLSLLGYLAQDLEDRSQAGKELTDPVKFLQDNYPGQTVWRFVLTHPDLDHMRGIKNLHDTVGFINFWDTGHTKAKPDFRSDDDKTDWEFYQKLRAGNTGDSHRFYTRGDRLFAFGADEFGLPGGDNIEILSPTPDLVKACNQAEEFNSLSLVLRVNHAGKTILFSGDAEDDAWDMMTAFYGQSLKSDFLKASHHGRDSGYNLKAVQLMAPAITFVSVGRKPDTDATSKYRQQCGRVASTRYYGNIEIQIDDNGGWKGFVDRNAG